ncbi:SDR family oxidoreductase [Kosakonia oryziphila]|uniref:NAD(P)-dependent dehydrogenase, short-chain alcohol dehydrogenase family n=1 Tax=Kosakonia oryziphila TaxID=1005667 RepID=A0A1C4D8R3_9ENTR|nr:SDR family oxidoreductase [Kosakonia oryziphila]SCC27723.1 NAD(P)-dependent dehydrogenase, short-chain alcohol dehydrogenase family [Kosakonia oryziphila]
MQTQSINAATRPDHFFKGQNIVIIGGSSGIGLETARQAKEAGGNVFLISRSPQRLQDASEAIGGAIQIVADIANPRPTIFAGIERIDHLFITAGTARLQPLTEESETDLRQVINERLIGPLLAVRAALPILHSASSVTLTSAQLSSRPLNVGAIMAAAVSAVESLTRALAIELSPIRVNAIAPGMIDTPLLDALMGDEKRKVLEQTASNLPAKVVGRPEDIAQAALFLMSNRFITGEVLHVDGGGRWV